jgi:hypothetical protein
MLLLSLATIPVASWRYRCDVTKFKRKEGSRVTSDLQLSAQTRSESIPTPTNRSAPERPHPRQPITSDNFIMKQTRADLRIVQPCMTISETYDQMTAQFAVFW